LNRNEILSLLLRFPAEVRILNRGQLLCSRRDVGAYLQQFRERQLAARMTVIDFDHLVYSVAESVHVQVVYKVVKAI
jgi:hypothetical protein